MSNKKKAKKKMILSVLGVLLTLLFTVIIIWMIWGASFTFSDLIADVFGCSKYTQTGSSQGYPVMVESSCRVFDNYLAWILGVIISIIVWGSPYLYIVRKRYSEDSKKKFALRIVVNIVLAVLLTYIMVIILVISTIPMLT